MMCELPQVCVCNFGIILFQKRLFNVKDVEHLGDLGVDGKTVAILKLIVEG